MYTTLLEKIETTLSGIARVKDHFRYPKTKLTKYPSVFYFPAGFENRYETGQENYKIFRFQMYVIVGIHQTTPEAAADVLAKTVQDIIQEFDTNWNMGVIDNHRAWVTLNSGEPWTMSQEQDGLELTAPLSLEIRLLTDI